jgi:hypothetical protein
MNGINKLHRIAPAKSFQNFQHQETEHPYEQ